MLCNVYKGTSKSVLGCIPPEVCVCVCCHPEKEEERFACDVTGVRRFHLRLREEEEEEEEEDNHRAGMRVCLRSEALLLSDEDARSPDARTSFPTRHQVC